MIAQGDFLKILNNSLRLWKFLRSRNEARRLREDARTCLARRIKWPKSLCEISLVLSV